MRLLDGDGNAGVWSAGMVAGLIHDIPTCQELVDRIMTEATAIIDQRLAGMRATASRDTSQLTGSRVE